MTDDGFDPDLVDAVTELFTRTVERRSVAEREDPAFPGELWSTVSELDFPLVGIEQAGGGAGGSILDALAVAVLTGRHAVPLPVVETNLAAWLLAASGLPVDSAAMTIAPGTARDDVVVHGGSAQGVLHDVPWASGAGRIVALVDDALLLAIDPRDAEIEAGHDLAGQPRDVVRFGRVPCRSAGPEATPRSLALRGALLRAGQIAGATEAVAATTIAYCGERQQFGRPLHAFQAVQQHLVTVAQAAELSATSVLRAGVASREREASFEISSAKLVANRCAADAVRATHQAHGAISMTREYHVQMLTRRLNAWRGEFGTDADLASVLGAAVAGAGSFFAAIASERDSPEVATCPAP